VSGGARNAREQVQWTCESSERRELKRAAGCFSRHEPLAGSPGLAAR